MVTKGPRGKIPAALTLTEISQKADVAVIAVVAIRTVNVVMQKMQNGNVQLMRFLRTTRRKSRVLVLK